MVVCKFFQQGYCRYGQSCRFEHIYGTKYSYRAPQSQNERTSQDGFNSGMRQGSTNNPASSLFRSAVQNTTVFNNAANNSPFGQNTQSKVSVFDRLGPQQNSVGFQSNQAKSIFAQANQNVFGQPTPSANIFQTQNQQAKSIFAQASQNIFGSIQHNILNQPRDTAASVFANAAQNLQHNDPFNQQKSSPFSNTTGNMFQISEKPMSNVFGVTADVLEQSNDDDSIYSKLEDLSKSDLEAFESLDFKLGFIPELPPPKSLCV